MTRSAAQATSVTPPEERERLRLQGLQHEVARSAAFARWVSWLAGFLVLVLIVLVVSLYLYVVMQYAGVSRVEASAIPGRHGAAEIVYASDSAGKIEFVRESAGLVETLTEYAKGAASPRSPKKFTWSGKENEQSSLRVTYRSGLFLVTKDLPLARAEAKD